MGVAGHEERQEQQQAAARAPSRAAMAEQIRAAMVRRGWIFSRSSNANPEHPLDIAITFTSDRERFQCWTLEALYTALTCRQPVVAFRSLLRARSYAERWGIHPGQSKVLDRWMEAASGRLETVLQNWSDIAQRRDRGEVEAQRGPPGRDGRDPARSAEPGPSPELAR